MSGLDDRLAATVARRRERDERARVRSTARLGEMERRWEAADGLGPLPASHAARQALEAGDLPRVRLALDVAERALEHREDSSVAVAEDPPAPMPAEDLPPSLRVLLDELLETGRPVKALTPAEARRSALKEGPARNNRSARIRPTTEPTSPSPDVTPIRARIRLDALRLRLLFDLDRFADRLGEDRRRALARDAGSASSADALFAIRERLLTALIGHPPDSPTG